MALFSLASAFMVTRVPLAVPQCMPLSARQHAPPPLMADVTSQIEAFLATDEMKTALSEVWQDDEDDETEHRGSQLAPDHARPIAVLDESVFVANAWREEDFLSRKEQPLAPIEEPSAAAAVKVLRSTGVGRIPAVLTAPTASALRTYILAELAATDHDAAPASADSEAFRLVVVGSGTQRLSDERGRSSLSTALRTALENDKRPSRNPQATPLSAAESASLRWDLRLPTSAPTVRRALQELLAPDAALGTAVEALGGGPSAELWELAAIVSAPGCAPQVVHADTVWKSTPLLFTSFIALQPITRDMGPTRFLPRTHVDQAAHKALQSHGDATGLGRNHGGQAQPPQSRVGCLASGDAALYDGRLLHCGGANRSDRLRVLFYLTVRHADAVGQDMSGDGAAAAAAEGSSVRLGDLRKELFEHPPKPKPKPKATGGAKAASRAGARPRSSMKAPSQKVNPNAKTKRKGKPSKNEVAGRRRDATAFEW